MADGAGSQHPALAMDGKRHAHTGKGEERDGLVLQDLRPQQQGRAREPVGSVTGTGTGAYACTSRAWKVGSIAGSAVWAASAPSPLTICAALAVCTGWATFVVLPEVARLLLAAGRKGRDMNKAHEPELAESAGVAVGSVYLVGMFVFLPVPFLLDVPEGARLMEPLSLFTAGLLSIASMLFLGFADDVLNLKWRHKVLLPAMAALPLLMLYRVSGGGTSVVVPGVGALLGRRVLDIGALYYVFMAGVAVFCTHSINILAGVNGVEVGQSVVIGCAVLVHNALCVWEGGGESRDVTYHYFSMLLLLPFVTGSAALLRYNWHPARVFVGDTYCYFAGMTLAVAGILGHFSKTLLLFFAPQLVNFALSVPQLCGVLPCPRHRLPRLDAGTGALCAREFVVEGWSGRGRVVRVVVGVVRGLGLGVVREERGEDRLVCTNLTLLTLLLVRGGPVPEAELARRFLAVQAGACVMGLLVRHVLAPLLYGQ